MIHADQKLTEGQEFVATYDGSVKQEAMRPVYG